VFTIRQATYADKPALAEFLAKAYPGREMFKYPERWDWAYENNPYLTNTAPPVWIAVHEDGNIIGQCNSLMEPLTIRGETHSVGWGVDFYVLEEFRGHGIGSQLQRANKEANQVFLSLSMAKIAYAIKKKMGMLELPAVPEYTKMVNHTAESIQYGSPSMRFIAAPLAKLLNWRDERPLKNFTLPKDISIARAAGFDAAFDELWERVSPKFAGLTRRDAAYLDWKYIQQPHATREIFTAQQGGEMTGYLILRVSTPPERNAGTILDLFCDPRDKDTIRALLHYGTCFLKSAGVIYITAASSVTSYQAVFTELGYKVTKTVIPMIHADVELPKDGWLLGKGDHDWDQYPLA
jgi:GNAT superfamily N-acetyltransferase